MEIQTNIFLVQLYTGGLVMGKKRESVMVKMIALTSQKEFVNHLSACPFTPERQLK